MKCAGGPALVRTAWGSGREAARNGSLGSGHHLEPFFFFLTKMLEPPKVRGEGWNLCTWWERFTQAFGVLQAWGDECWGQGGGGTLPCWGDLAGGFPTSACSLLTVIERCVLYEMSTAQLVSQRCAGRWFAPRDLGVEGKWERKKCWKERVCFSSFLWEEGIKVHPRGDKHF